MILKIGTYEVPDDHIDVDGYTVKFSDMDSANTGRGESGYMTRERIRANVASLTATLKALTNAQMQQLMTATSPAAFTVVFQWAGQTYTKTMMRSGDIEVTALGSGYWELDLNLIEY